MEFSNHIPIYLQIIDRLKKDLVLGIKKPGDKLESVREYALHLKVNPNTIQKAYQEMERMELVYSKRGIGRFIVEDKSLVETLMLEMSSEIVNDFISKMSALGYQNEEILKRLEEALGGNNGFTSEELK